MIIQPHSANVAAEFLRNVLAGGAVAVPELEARARAAGLLGDHQSITHAKAFKRAKKALSIRSVRNGFGDKGEWCWSLMNQAATPPPSDRPLPGPIPVGDTSGDVQEESSVEDNTDQISAERRVQFDWVEGVAHLNNLRPPADVPPHWWRQFLADCNNFLNASEGWAERAVSLGWNALALFGCRRNVPLLYLGDAGLLWAINGGRLVELHRDWAVIEPAANVSRRIFRRRHNIDPEKVTLPWIGLYRRA